MYKVMYSPKIKVIYIKTGLRSKAYRVGVFRRRVKGRGRGVFFEEFFTNEKPPRH